MIGNLCVFRSGEVFGNHSLSLSPKQFDHLRRGGSKDCMVMRGEFTGRNSSRPVAGLIEQVLNSLHFQMLQRGSYAPWCIQAEAVWPVAVPAVDLLFWLLKHVYMTLWFSGSKS
jgi:hypothetical protein